MCFPKWENFTDDQELPVMLFLLKNFNMYLKHLLAQIWIYSFISLELLMT